jgi:hypothetical protein
VRSLGEGEKEEENEEADASCYCSSTQLGVQLSSEKKWLRIWDEVSNRILKLPLWMQHIILDDIKATVKNRIAVMERVQKKEAGK